MLPSTGGAGGGGVSGINVMTGGAMDDAPNNDMDIATETPTPTSNGSALTMTASRAAVGPPINSTIFHEFWTSSEHLFATKLSWLLILGPLALFGDATGILGEAACFSFSGIALIPCAERLSFVTEQVALHTNGTIGALLNATFGNAPELLIATAALRSGYYRLVQLAMLGSMLTNLLFVFGISCLVGGLRWQVQELRITSGNVNVGMLLLSTTGSLLPAALILSGQSPRNNADNADAPSTQELQFSRVNAFVMISMYICYLIFQLGTHKEEFDEDENSVEVPGQFKAHNKAARNIFCQNLFIRLFRGGHTNVMDDDSVIGHATLGDVEMLAAGRKTLNKKLRSSDRTLINDNNTNNNDKIGNHFQFNNLKIIESGSLPFRGGDDNNPGDNGDNDDGNSLDEQSARLLEDANGIERPVSFTSSFGSSDAGDNVGAFHDSGQRRRRHTQHKEQSHNHQGQHHDVLRRGPYESVRGAGGGIDADNLPPPPPSPHEAPKFSFRVGIIWLFIITLCISAMSDILVDTIGGFANRLKISEVFTSMVILPYFSNVAEQVSAILFAYRNEMDLCVGVTVGSAIQVATFVLPGCVLIGVAIDRSMTLYFHGYETACLVLAVIVVAAVLQGGTTNWLVGAMLVGIYIMIATGFWFHELEYLSVDAEIAINNSTAAVLGGDGGI